MPVSKLEGAKSFVSRSLLGGVAVLLPLAIISLFFRWIYRVATDLVQPLTNLFVGQFGLHEVVADVLVFLCLLISCLVVGYLVATRGGRWIYHQFDSYLIERVPGYQSVRQVITQLLERNTGTARRGEVARVQLFGAGVATTVTALVTSWHDDGTCTVFVPTGPNPTSGMIYHVDKELVETFPDISVEQMMKTVIACGAGSAALFNPAVDSD